MTKIVLSSCHNFIWEFTHNRAIDNVCRKNNIELKIVSINGSANGFVDTVEVDNDVDMYINVYNPGNSQEAFQTLRQKLPNAKFVGIGSDMMYNGTQLNWPYDIFVDYTQSICDEIEQTNKCKCYTIHWTLSEDVIDICKRYSNLEQVKENDLIAMCRCSVGDRPYFLSELSKLGLTVSGDLLPESLYDNHPYRSTSYMDRISVLIPYYNKSLFVFGTSSSIWSGAPRSMKGLRDYMAPFCGCGILFDDYPDMRNISQDMCLPIYEYGQMVQVQSIITFYKKNIDLYQSLIRRQSEWVQHHTLETYWTDILSAEKII